MVFVVLTVVFRAIGVDQGVDQTEPDDYWADEADEGVDLELDPLAEPHRWLRRGRFPGSPTRR